MGSLRESGGLQAALTERDAEFIRRAAELFIPKYDLVVYGSRARGDHHWNSDLDLAIYGAQDNLDHAILEFKNVMEHALVTPTVTVVEMHLVTGSLREFVLKDGILLYEGSGPFNKERARLESND